jgi:Protein of unknown function (DUF2442)
MNPHVKDIQILDNYCLLITFTNTDQRIFDAKPYLERGIFTVLKNPDLFAAAKIISGSVEWPNEIDLSYDTLYLDSLPFSQETLYLTQLAPLEADLEKFVRQYKMQSETFYQCFQIGELEKTQDFLEWHAIYGIWLQRKARVDMLLTHESVTCLSESQS